jgi:hypothetical protein
LLLKLSGTIITEINKLPENLRLKVFSGNNLENAIKLRFFCLFSYKKFDKNSELRRIKRFLELAL